MIQINNEQHWLYAAVDPETNESLHVRLFQTYPTQLTVLFLRELRDKQHLEQVTFLVDNAHYLTTALARLGLRFQARRYGNRRAVERVFREIKRCTSSFANTFRHVELPTAKTWFQAFAAYHNATI